jgi:phosphoglucomutase
MLSPAVEQKVTSWLNGNYDQATKDAIKSLSQDELNDSFYKDLEFGTGGMRGVMGAGTNRINKYTLGATTQGLSNYLKKSFQNQEIRVAIAHDSRNNSFEFARVVAGVFAANGIKVFLFEGMRPTPELSFAIRELKCQSGIVLTASHNPREYNGYKAYWDDGAQIVAPHDKNIIDQVNAIQNLEEIQFADAEGHPNIEMIGEELDKLYLAQVKSLAVATDAIAKHNDIKIVYTPLHGTGITLVPQAFEQLGFKNVHIVEEQAIADGNFPTVIYPNPEEEEAMSMALNLARKVDADIVMASDPDADRVGIAVKNHQNEFILLNGNQTGSLIIGYLIEAWKEAGKLDGNQMIVKTVVTSELIDEIALQNGVKCFNTLTGFKHIASMVRKMEGKLKFITGGEESYGYMVGDAVRDKDSVACCAVLAEMVAYAKSKDQTLFDFLLATYVKYGFYQERLISIVKKGQKGGELIKEMMHNFRANPPKTINNSKVVRLLDYQILKERNIETGEERDLDFPVSNVLQFYTKDGSKISVRPSGTEPKIKFYFSVNTQLDKVENFEQKEAELNQKIDAIIKDMKL